MKKKYVICTSLNIHNNNPFFALNITLFKYYIRQFVTFNKLFLNFCPKIKIKKIGFVYNGFTNPCIKVSTLFVECTNYL